MLWLNCLLQFLAGILFANGVPHFFHGVIGKAFPTPFAKPPGVGLSPPLVNVVWGAANFVIGGILLGRHLPRGGEVVVGWGLFVAGAVVSGVFLAKYFGGLKSRPQ